MSVRKIFIIFLCVIFVLFTGCSFDSVAKFAATGEITTESADTSLFSFETELVGTDSNGCRYYRDITTDVLYLWRKAANAGGFTIMLDPDTGLPLTYSRCKEIYDLNVELSAKNDIEQ